MLFWGIFIGILIMTILDFLTNYFDSSPPSNNNLIDEEDEDEEDFDL